MLNNEDGYRLWLRYDEITDGKKAANYRNLMKNVVVIGEGPTVEAIRSELELALPSLLGQPVPVLREISEGNTLVIGLADDIEMKGIAISVKDRSEIGDQGFCILSYRIDDTTLTVIAANTAAGLPPGVFHFLRLLQTEQDIENLSVISNPRIRRRILAHWDNLDGFIERGYAEQSLWRWEELSGKVDTRYLDYARACASIGINGSVLNNPNSRPETLSAGYLKKTAALADVFRPYGIRIYLSANFNSPVLLDSLPTSDPRDPAVAAWWKNKVDEIYRLIPDFGGFQVKAWSEGQPGPQDYGAGHDDGANMLADALRNHGGVVFWRAFVYSTGIDADRARCAYDEFVPLDGRFRPNAFIQVKNGPVDFQPREPFHPLFGGMPETPLALEIQITQEYLGQSTHLVYLAPMWKEVLDADTYCKGAGSTVAIVTDGSLYGDADSAIVAVSNTGSDTNWCGHHFAQANWYAFGRLAWDHQLTADRICEEWVRMTWSNDPAVWKPLKDMMMGSWEACVSYMVPLGLHHIMKEGHHYGPNPAYHDAPREDWSNTYYHKADTVGLGFDRSSTGSNATEQYFSPLRETFDDLNTCPEKYLLWFHHVPWLYRLSSGRNLIEELEYRYASGVDYVTGMKELWHDLREKIDPPRWEHVRERLEQQEENAREWRDVCMEYFRRFPSTQ